jgi:hypothetical protein
MMNRTLYVLLLSIILWTSSQTIHSTPVTYTQQDSLFIVQCLQNEAASIVELARQLIGRPYVAHTLEVNDNEQLVVNTRELDCTTLVETVTALWLCKQKGLSTFSDYCDMLSQLRYRQGKLNDYTSRLHYFSDWIEDKTQMGFVTEIQKHVPPFTAIQQLRIHYMSKHPNAYAALRKHPEFIKEIARQERTLTGRHYRYIPKSKVNNSASLRSIIKDGDIIAITCSKPGLDIAHLGFAVWHKDGLHLLNASQLHKQVVEEPMTLGEYLSKHPSHTGIRIIRISLTKTK